ncbi:lactonase family protein [Algoriphagus vanfongensis]|uniref:lactonase family protein n=1 Tax=Algoriphagus vanfongensis TaxID=426371 RepID=UPI000686F7DD|nr:lactonase family protein [Algoriphagus vanfongensis]
MKQRWLLPILAGLFSCSSPTSSTQENSTPMTYSFLVGTYTKSDDQGLDFLTLVPKKDSVHLQTLVPNLANPSFVLASKDGKKVFTLQEEAGKGGGKIVSFERNPTDNQLTLLDSMETQGDHPCHIALSPDEDFLILSNYSGGSLSGFRVDLKGRLAFSQLIQHEGSSVNPDRQEAPHVHSATFSPDGKNVLVADLGSDEIYIYSFEVEKEAPLNLKTKVSMTPGDGPRHLAFSKDGNQVYVVQEMTAVLEIFDFKDENLTSRQRLSLLQDDFDGSVGAAEVRVSPDGNHIYVSNRGDANTISAFKRTDNGELALISHYPSGGIMPRNFNLTADGQYLVSAHQQSGDIVIFKRNVETGELTQTGLRTKGNQPVYLFPLTH